MIFQVTLRPYYEQEDYGSHSTYECNTLEECISSLMKGIMPGKMVLM